MNSYLHASLRIELQWLAQAPQAPPSFKSTSEIVVLHVSVVDGRAGFVSGLPKEAFSIYEDGRPQPIALFSNDDTPVTVGLVIDSSGSMAPRRAAVIAAGMAFAESSRPLRNGCPISLTSSNRLVIIAAVVCSSLSIGPSP